MLNAIHKDHVSEQTEEKGKKNTLTILKKGGLKVEEDKMNDKKKEKKNRKNRTRKKNYSKNKMPLVIKLTNAFEQSNLTA